MGHYARTDIGLIIRGILGVQTMVHMVVPLGKHMSDTLPSAANQQLRSQEMKMLHLPLVCALDLACFRFIPH